jgi:hypothetical protein
MSTPIDIAVVTEDDLSLAVLERVINSCGRSFRITLPLVERGFGNIKRSIVKYRQASHVLPHVVLTDLDKSECAADLRNKWGAVNLPETMMFRVAVRETEAWLLADRKSFANFAGIPPSKLPAAPDTLLDPKQTLINLVRRSRFRRLAAELVPPVGSQVSIGPLYNERLAAFAREHWSPEAAVSCSPSLERTFRRLQTFLR